MSNDDISDPPYKKQKLVHDLHDLHNSHDSNKKRKLTDEPNESDELPIKSIELTASFFIELLVKMRMESQNDTFKLYGIDAHNKYGIDKDTVCFSMSGSNTNMSEWNYYGEYDVFPEQILRTSHKIEYLTEHVTLIIYPTFIKFELYLKNILGDLNFCLIRK